MFTHREFFIEQLQKLKVKDETALIDYVDFCISNTLDKRETGKTELHHVLVKSVFKEYKNLTKYAWNGVHLTYKNHYIAHSLLAKAINEKRIIYAWWCLNSLDKKLTSSYIGPDLYSELREKHVTLVRDNQIKRNKNPELRKKRKQTLAKKDEYGRSGFQQMGKKISKTQIERGSCKGEKNGCYKKIIVKERLNPTKRKAVSDGWDVKKYVAVQMTYQILYDNTGKEFFRGWIDECREFCESKNLESKKLKAKGGKIFDYTNDYPPTKYLIKIMKLAGLGRYINSFAKVIKDEDVQKVIKNSTQEVGAR